MEGPPRVSCVSRPRVNLVKFSDATQKFLNVTLLLLLTLDLRPRSVSKYQ